KTHEKRKRGTRGCNARDKLLGKRVAKVWNGRRSSRLADWVAPSRMHGGGDAMDPGPASSSFRSPGPSRSQGATPFSGGGGSTDSRRGSVNSGRLSMTPGRSSAQILLQLRASGAVDCCFDGFETAETAAETADTGRCHDDDG
ncbi:unnamed protein product, partial [Phaeothamnion confervicola]